MLLWQPVLTRKVTIQHVSDRQSSLNLSVSIDSLQWLSIVKMPIREIFYFLLGKILEKKGVEIFPKNGKFLI